jgi:hypothetical protein
VPAGPAHTTTVVLRTPRGPLHLWNGDVALGIWCKSPPRGSCARSALCTVSQTRACALGRCACCRTRARPTGSSGRKRQRAPRQGHRIATSRHRGQPPPAQRPPQQQVLSGSAIAATLRLARREAAQARGEVLILDRFSGMHCGVITSTGQRWRPDRVLKRRELAGTIFGGPVLNKSGGLFLVPFSRAGTAGPWGTRRGAE